MTFDGYNFEDAIVISERLVKDDTFTCIHIDEYDGEIRETKLGREEFTRDIPNVSEKALRNLDESGVVRVGTRVGPGDILVGKVAPKSKSELTPEEKLLHAIFGRAGEDVKNDSLELPGGEEGVVIDTEGFSRRGAGGDEQKKVLADETKKYEAEERAKACSIFRQMVDGDQREVRGQTMVDPNTQQKVGASEDDEVIFEQIENFDIKWVKPAAARDDVQKVVDKFWAEITRSRRREEAAHRARQARRRAAQRRAGDGQGLRGDQAARCRSATRWPAGTATRASSPASCPKRTCRSWRTARRWTSCSTRWACPAV